MATVDILIPTYNRLRSLVMTLSGVALQSSRDLRVVVSDQSDDSARDSFVVQALCRVIEARGDSVDWHRRPPVHGIAEQRAFLLGRATASMVLYLDDDVLMQPLVVEKLAQVLQAERCGFVGAFPAGLSHVQDVRPDEQQVEFWEGRVRPEVVNPGSAEWERYKLNRLANAYHVSKTLLPGEFRLYKVAWAASCVMYDRAKLEQVGGFAFWRRLPRFHSGEEVVAQNLLMRRWGGCGLMPSGTYYAELPSTVLNEEGGIDGHALELLPELIRRYAPETAVEGIDVNAIGW